MPNPITSVSLEEYFVDKDTGAPLSGGYVQFWKDADRTDPKLVYQKVATGALDAAGNPVYEFEALPDPVQLSAVGTPQNAGGDNIAIYYWPYEGTPTDSTGVVELYYVAIFNSLGVPQFTREGWPGSGVSSGSGDGSGTAENMLTNPQFADISFSEENGVAYTSAGAETATIPVGADWDLVVTFTGVGTVTMTRVPITGVSNRITNPPFSLSVVVGSNISGLFLRQRLQHNPGIWASTDAGVGGYLATYMLLGPASNATISYEPSVGAPTQLLTGNNVAAEYVAFTETVQLTPSANTDDGDDGYVDILVTLRPSGTNLITSLQIVPLQDDVDGVEFVQEPVNRQVDHMFNYYNDLLQYKPIPSFLIGWDFPQNPVQFLGPTVAASAIGANKSKYVWDQTIIFQSANSGVGVTSGTNDAIVLTAAATTQMAIIQYIDGQLPRELLTLYLAAHIRAFTNQVGGVPITISLWYTNDASLPNINAGTNNSLVLTLDANGKPATFNGTWVEVPRSNLGNATFTMAQGTDYTDYGFAHWFNSSGAGITTAQFFAIVVGTGSVTMGNTINIQSISLVPGKIPTIPAPQHQSQVVFECQSYYEKSFELNTVPAQNVGVNTGEFSNSQILGAGVSTRLSQIPFKVNKRGTPNITLYNPAAANAEVRNETLGADCSASSVTTSSPGAFAVSCVTAGGSAVGETLGVHWTADARLGIL